MARVSRRQLDEIYHRLSTHFGPTYWWPGDSPFEIAVGAILTQNTAWTNVEKAIANIKRARELAPEVIVADIARLEQKLSDDSNGFMLIGRREVRSNNSWMHNLPMLVSGKARCTLQIHPDDAAKLNLANGAQATVRSRVGEVRIPVEITDTIMRGTVSAPHGWGHDTEGAQLSIARDHAGVNSNLLTDEMCLDVPSGTAVLCGIPVTIER